MKNIKIGQIVFYNGEACTAVAALVSPDGRVNNPNTSQYQWIDIPSRGYAMQTEVTTLKANPSSELRFKAKIAIEIELHLNSDNEQQALQGARDWVDAQLNDMPRLTVQNISLVEGDY